MPFSTFDLSKLRLLPLNERVHDLRLQDILFDEPPEFDHPSFEPLCKAMITAREKGAAVILMYGGHVIRQGCAGLMIRLMEKGWVTHFATNGAGAIHDFELAMIGQTCESVERYISKGQFGLWRETGSMNEAVNGAGGLGFGEAVGRYINEGKFPYAGSSVLAAGARLGVPVTVHVGIGNDIIHSHPNFDGAATGRASAIDFLVYTKAVENLEHGVFLNVGSAVTGPEVYLKALSMARNVAHQEGRKIAYFTTAVFDKQPIGENIHAAPDRSDPKYFFRPWKTILARTVADGGQSYYIQGDHRETLGNLAVRLLKMKM